MPVGATPYIRLFPFAPDGPVPQVSPMVSVPAARRDRQVVRLISLLKTLLDGGRPSVYDLAARFHTRREIVYRDLRAL